MRTRQRLQDWARSVAEASPKLDSEGREVAVQTHRLLAKGEPVSIQSIASAAQVDADVAGSRLRSWPLVFWDDEDRIVGFWGLAIAPLEPTHAMEVRGVTLYAWCAWDTLFITEILDVETRVSSVDPNSGASIDLVVTPEGVASVDPETAVVSLLLPDRNFDAETISRFCHRIHFFSSPESAQAWIGDRPDLFTVTVDEAFELGRLTNRLRLGTGSEMGRTPRRDAD